MVVLDDISLRFGDIVALDHVSLDVAAGEIMCLLGPSGSGKSTLLRIVAGITRAEQGRVSIAGTEMAGPDVFVEPEHRRVGMVFQDYALFPHLTVAENVAFGLRDRNRTGIAAAVGRLLERLGLSRYASSYPHMLSGGERQRVALARALAPQPRVLLMDEPFSGLDGQLRDRIRHETLEVLRETGITTIVVTHDPSEAMRMADRLTLLRSGRVVQHGSVDDVYRHPASAFAARFLSEVNEVAGRSWSGRVDTPLGTFAAPHLPDDVAVRVCIRPQHVRAAVGPTGIPATVVSCECLGDTDRTTLAVAGLDAPVSLRTFGRAAWAPGHTIFLDVDASGVVVVPDDEPPNNPPHA